MAEQLGQRGFEKWNIDFLVVRISCTTANARRIVSAWSVSGKKLSEPSIADSQALLFGSLNETKKYRAAVMNAKSIASVFKAAMGVAPFERQAWQGRSLMARLQQRCFGKSGP